MRSAYFFGLLGLAAVLAGPLSHSVAAPLAVAFVQDLQPPPGATSPVQGTFIPLAGVVGNSAGGTTGDVTVSFPTPDGGGHEGFYDRGDLSNSGSFTYAALYNSFAYTNADDDPIQVSISHLTPNAPYTLTLYSYDTLQAGGHTQATTTFTAGTGTTIESGTPSVTYSTAPTSNDQYSTTLLVETSTGTLTLFAQAPAVGGGQDGTRVNGFVLGAVVPEPASVTLMTFGVLLTGGAAVWRRRRLAA